MGNLEIRVSVPREYNTINTLNSFTHKGKAKHPFSNLLEKWRVIVEAKCSVVVQS